MRLKLQRAAKRFERPKTFDEYRQMFRYIYGEVDEKLSDEQLLLRLAKEFLLALEPVRKDGRSEEDSRKIGIKLARIFRWRMAIADRFNLDSQEIHWHKFPGVCPYCLRDHDCSCAVEHPDIPDKENILKRLRMERHGREPETLTEHMALHKKLYGRQNARILPMQTVSHIGEEIGENLQAWEDCDLEKLEDELPDVDSWIFATATRFELNFDQVVWEEYPYECNKCHYNICRCPELKRGRAKGRTKHPKRCTARKNVH
jgi:NTP pyrophosphatase (non-canonical NTP hydrolase)